MSSYETISYLIKNGKVDELSYFLKRNEFSNSELLPFTIQALILCQTRIFEVFLEEGKVEPSDYLLEKAIQYRCPEIVKILIEDPRVDPWSGLKYAHSEKILDILNSHIDRYSSSKFIRNYNLPLDRIIDRLDTDIQIIDRRLAHDRYPNLLLGMRDKLQAKKLEVISVKF